MNFAYVLYVSNNKNVCKNNRNLPSVEPLMETHAPMEIRFIKMNFLGEIVTTNVV